jgi:predicted ArsR family transcriptional regulator
VGEDRTGGPGPTNQRVTVPEAAEQLGITAEAVRMRIKRGTLRSERQAGRVFVLLGPDRPTEHTTERTEPTEDRTAELIATLQEQLAEEREARRRADTIIAQLARANEEQARTIRELEAPSEPPSEAPSEASETPETAEEEPERAEPYPAAGGAQEGAQRPWWRRVFGG